MRGGEEAGSTHCERARGWELAWGGTVHTAPTVHVVHHKGQPTKHTSWDTKGGKATSSTTSINGPAIPQAHHAADLLCSITLLQVALQVRCHQKGLAASETAVNGAPHHRRHPPLGGPGNISPRLVATAVLGSQQ